MDKPRWIAAGGAALAGAGIGVKFGGPVGAALGALIGGVAGLVLEPIIIKHPLIPPSAMQALTGLFHPTHPTLAAQVAESGAAKAAAQALYAALTSGTGTAALVTAFQQISNTDPNARTLTGPLQVTGVYDVPTSAALTLYTHDPIPPATPPAPQPMTAAQAADAFVPGAAATSGFNAYTYLKKRGNDRSAALQRLVHQFQIDVNNDPKFPGPAAPAARIITARLAETGVYDLPTSKALTVMSNDPVSP